MAQPPLEVGGTVHYFVEFAGDSKAFMRLRKGARFTQRAPNPNFSVGPDALRLPVGVAHTAHAGRTPIASLIPAAIIRAQYANLSHNTFTQFPAE